MYHKRYRKFSVSEIKRQKHFPLDEHCLKVFNNFFYHFPAGTKPHIPQTKVVAELGFNRFTLLNRKDVKIRKHIGDTKYVTPMFFYQELDVVLKELEIELSLVSELINPLQCGKIENVNWKKVFKILSKIYIKMRERGYSAHTLWA